jgi:hypothetical protein
MTDMGTSDSGDLRRTMPEEEKHQPDPMLQMSTGDIGAGGIALVGLVSAVVLGIVLYGLNAGEKEQAASAPAAQNVNPQDGGNSDAGTPGAPRANQSGVKG